MDNHTKPDRKTALKRVFIVDDHPLFREGLARIIGQMPGLVVCGEANDAVHALDDILRLDPDLALVDISLPGMSGLDLLRRIRAVKPKLPALVISMHDESLYAVRALRAGGHGYIMKQEGPNRLLKNAPSAS